MDEKDIQFFVLDNEDFDQQLADLGRALGYPEDEITDAMERVKEETGNGAVQKARHE